ncbi:epoxyqueuosine reductase [Veillonella ratti]|uniref:epoxyqueuosine reductase n=1 Tax=Veillonella ratti TaxID=103892 RepID=UPI000F8F5909|nr:QueG-associated DUF1730 domain-containing protein [Veillonella ratti]
MITRNDIFQIAKKLNIPAVGIAPWPLPDDAANYIDTANPCPFINGTLEERLTANTALQSPKSAIVCLFPYYVKTDEPINLPRYAWGPDYHLVIPEYLKRFGTALQEIDSTVEFEIHCDTSPMADRYVAYLAGLGVFGKNRALIHPVWGSYTSIGTLLTSCELTPDTPMPGTCYGCNRCINACPGQSLGRKEFGFETCKSYLTQKKGDLPPHEVAIIQKTPLIWGCDICQEVCPHNRNVPTTPIPEFQTIEPYVSPATLEGLTNKTFKAAYGDRAFSWRGKAVLLRNTGYVADTLTTSAITATESAGPTDSADVTPASANHHSSKDE